MLLIEWVVLILVVACVLYACWFIREAIRNDNRITLEKIWQDEQLLLWPERDYQPYCEQCGSLISKMHRIRNLHYNAYTGEADVKSVELFYECPQYTDYYNQHYHETVDEYTMVLSGTDKWKRKVG